MLVISHTNEQEANEHYYRLCEDNKFACITPNIDMPGQYLVIYEI